MRIFGRGQPWHENASVEQQARTPRWSFLLDWPWSKEARELGLQDLMPWRINMWTPWGWLGIALTPGSRFVSSWNPTTQYHDPLVHWIQWAPR